jgi:hypothetical protein
MFPQRITRLMPRYGSQKAMIANWMVMSRTSPGGPGRSQPRGSAGGYSAGSGSERLDLRRRSGHPPVADLAVAF